MKIVYLKKEEWAELSAKAHLIVFNEHRDPKSERIDFALLADEQDIAKSYVTCRELDSESLYWQYGGSFPGTKGTVSSLKAFTGFVNWAKEHGYKRILFYVQNTNKAMLKLAMKCGFLICGVRNFQQNILVEHFLEFQ